MIQTLHPHHTAARDIALDVPGVLMPFGLGGRVKNDALLATAGYLVPVTCRVQPPGDLNGRIWRAHVHLRDLPNGVLEVETAVRDDRLDPLALIPRSACRLPGVVDGFLSLAASIHTRGLRQILSEVFTQSVVFENFWNVPAAPDHHYWRCGLAWHTLEVARDLDARLATTTHHGSPWAVAEHDL